MADVLGSMYWWWTLMYGYSILRDMDLSDLMQLIYSLSLYWYADHKHLGARGGAVG
jgi:hypothetical protein